MRESVAIHPQAGTQPAAALPPGSPQLHRVLDALPAAAYICDPDGRITYFNARAAEIWGREPKLNDPGHRYCGSFKLHSVEGGALPHAECWMALALRDNREYNGREIVIERPDGGRVTGLAFANPIHDESGALIGAVNVILDITERKRAEKENEALNAQLREADRRKDEFLAILAHELRNPLAPIRNALELLRHEDLAPAAREQSRVMIERQVNQMVRLVDDLLDASRITNRRMVLRKERVDLGTVVRNAVESARPLIEAAGVELLVEVPQHPVYVDADVIRLAQVFANLLHNAAKYTPRGGRIALTGGREGNEVVVRVRDSGIGIAPEALPRIFDMFTQAEPAHERSQGGLGIGLSLARGLVQLHGGTLEAESEGRGRGSEFTVRLPLLLGWAPESRPPEDPRGRPMASVSYKVLVVDDSEDSARSLAMVLEAMGSQVRLAHDGERAIAAAEEFRPDIVFMDIGLPRMNGYEAGRRIRAQSWGGDVFLIAVTGWGQEEDKRRSAEAGFDLHLVKPLDLEEVERLLATHRPPSGR